MHAEETTKPSIQIATRSHHARTHNSVHRCNPHAAAIIRIETSKTHKVEYFEYSRTPPQSQRKTQQLVSIRNSAAKVGIYASLNRQNETAQQQRQRRGNKQDKSQKTRQEKKPPALEPAKHIPSKCLADLTHATAPIGSPIIHPSIQPNQPLLPFCP
ncbi:hypothetical protein B0T14DRAFT_296461 [Immersiella caudata]|uniref:Uncharacterized protein n=1 Tax=Immersiella caudata TaxID=314043 RepID=A0AA40BUF8_9PEZI|nr:hypothetical protein B0T14DRAFT_296461 [Immersiella caudata]